MNSKQRLVLVFLLFMGLSQGYSQSDKEHILDLRNASNRALKANDQEKVLSYLTDDVLITTGNGNLLAGKEALRSYILKGDSSDNYWIRTPAEIEINEQRGLAWETGTWKAYHREQGDSSILGGKYSAMWSSESGSWLIKSQRFVTLE